MPDEEYSLGKSAKGLGQLYPILKDKRGNIIDGFHRQNEDPDWHTLKAEQIDTDQKLELARLATNFCRRTIPATEFQNRLRFLIDKCGMKPLEIAEVTGIGLSTIYNHLPQDLKNQDKVEAGKASGEARASVPLVEQTVKTQDTTQPETKLQKPFITPTQTINPDDFVLCAGCMNQVHKDRAVPMPQNPERFIHPNGNCLDLAKERLKHLSKSAPKDETPKTVKPSDYDSWPTRRDRMASCHSKVEDDFAIFLARYREILGPIAGPRKLAVIEIESDNCIPRFNAYPFLDGVVHKDRRDKDDWLRGTYAKHHPEDKLIPLYYERHTPKTGEELGWQFLECLGLADQARELDKHRNMEQVKP